MENTPLLVKLNAAIVPRNICFLINLLVMHSYSSLFTSCTMINKNFRSCSSSIEPSWSDGASIIFGLHQQNNITERGEVMNQWKYFQELFTNIHHECCISL